MPVPFACSGGPSRHYPLNAAMVGPPRLVSPSTLFCAFQAHVHDFFSLDAGPPPRQTSCSLHSFNSYQCNFPPLPSAARCIFLFPCFHKSSPPRFLGRFPFGRLFETIPPFPLAGHRTDSPSMSLPGNPMRVQTA